MASQQSTVDYILEQIASAGSVSARKMFGEYALYCDGKTVALVCDDQLFVKPTVSGRAFVEGGVEDFPYPGAKPWLLVSGDSWDDAFWLSQLIRLTSAELPIPKAKSPKKKAEAKKVST
jgi:DNA transformation protein